MLHRLRRHPIPIVAHFKQCLVLTYALPAQTLQPLLPPGLAVDAFDGVGFVAVAMVSTSGLRPAGAPAALGQDFFLTGYRVFSRFRTSAGRTLRGLRILRSDTDKRAMACVGNLLTHYNYQRSQVSMTVAPGRLTIDVRTPGAVADLRVEADLGAGGGLPEGSPFPDERAARRFAGPLPFTFDYERETNSIVVIKGVRENWSPRLVRVAVPRCTFFEQEAFRGVTPVLSSAFHVSDIPYRWERGALEPIASAAA